MLSKEGGSLDEAYREYPSHFCFGGAVFHSSSVAIKFLSQKRLSKGGSDRSGFCSMRWQIYRRDCQADNCCRYRAFASVAGYRGDSALEIPSRRKLYSKSVELNGRFHWVEGDTVYNPLILYRLHIGPGFARVPERFQNRDGEDRL